MNQSFNLQESLRILKDSTVFHMSLGSKELFHSNFLHWLSDQYWDFFIKVMHKLADENDNFWWENENGPNGLPYSPSNNNVKVLRENKNFDLSIYILDSETTCENENENEQSYMDTVTLNSTIAQKWIPVLVLENKMKSIPYEEQLDNYTKKAFDEWSKGDKIKNIINDQKEEVDEKHWNRTENITFILLSLLDAKNIKDQYKRLLPYKRNGQRNLIFDFVWHKKTYKNLLDIYNSCELQFHNDLDRQVFEDYCRFVDALCNIANDDWIIENLTSKYIETFCPWCLEPHNPDYDTQVQLRIDDIRQKVQYVQLQDMLINKMEEMSPGIGNRIKRVSSPSNIKLKEMEDIEICCSTNFLHNVGLLEIYVKWIINKEPFLIGIQIQGDVYEHFFYDVYNASKVEVYKTLDCIKEKLSKFFQFPNYNKIEFPEVFPSIIFNKPNKRFEKGYRDWCFGCYDPHHIIYQKVKISNDVTIDSVVSAIVKDVVWLLENRPTPATNIVRNARRS